MGTEERTTTITRRGSGWGYQCSCGHAPHESSKQRRVAEQRARRHVCPEYVVIIRSVSTGEEWQATMGTHSKVDAEEIAERERAEARRFSRGVHVDVRPWVAS